ncbi:uncharacterized protein M421DRAFT_424187 [Didymella exigua CBS 183.55]|uniref:Uncharacterized protein n=1 Tax=Didymella exigua CBS 183.55 TaxID=1150837 RepID=A0A6A5RF77_9PLEO|nr:uncharacterized protein M421DRAFT_424187 [Didymella exigua CBS 183.55]KAF1925166.1 hypothetical protein M421DRAFT_424187 [Didymella exigua CBS 183.55]
MNGFTSRAWSMSWAATSFASVNIATPGSFCTMRSNLGASLWAARYYATAAAVAHRPALMYRTMTSADGLTPHVQQLL